MKRWWPTLLFVVSNNQRHFCTGMVDIIFQNIKFHGRMQVLTDLFLDISRLGDDRSRQKSFTEQSEHQGQWWLEQTININVHNSALIGPVDVFRCHIVITLYNLFHLNIQLQQMTKYFRPKLTTLVKSPVKIMKHKMAYQNWGSQCVPR